MNTNTMNNMNKNLKAATLAFLVLSALLISSCGSTNLEGTYVGKGKLFMKNAGYVEPTGTGSNMSINITKESQGFALHILDKETAAECIVTVTPTIRDEFSMGTYHKKVCELAVDGVSHELKNYTTSGNGEQTNGEIKIQISFYSNVERDSKDKFEFEFEGKRTS